MARSERQLQIEAEEIFRRVVDKPGLGMLLMMFESRDMRSKPPLAICVHGMSTEKAVRVLREQADRLEKVAKEESEIQVNQPIIHKPS